MLDTHSLEALPTTEIAATSNNNNDDDDNLAWHTKLRTMNTTIVSIEWVLGKEQRTKNVPLIVSNAGIGQR